jgi:ubiquinone/menaquinone biosynthesis C-methylase UbiE
VADLATTADGACARPKRPPSVGRVSQPDHDSTAGRYTHGHEASTLASHGARTAANSAAYLLPLLRPGMSVLDVGCGPGTITLDLAEVVAPGRAVGIENVEAPLAAARMAAAERGDRATVFEVADALALPFDDDSFDVVHAHQVLQHLTDPVGALRQMRRVCRRGGWLAARDADYAAMAWYPEVPEIEEWRTTYRAIARANGAQPDAGRRLRAWAREADLLHARVTTSVWSYADPSACRWWGEGQAARVEGATFTSQAASIGVSEEQVRAIAHGWRRWATEPDAWFMIPHGELLAQV